MAPLVTDKGMLFAAGSREAAHRTPGPAFPVLPVLITFLAGAATAVWSATAVLTAGHGFDITDEGFYLLSYRWWDSNHRTFTGAQYVYGPVFQALGYDIAGLRLVRLASVLGTHLAFGWAFMGWLRLRRPAAPPSRWWEAAGTATVVAAGGMVFAWLPLSPGYNDLALLSVILGAALAVRVHSLVQLGREVPAWLALAWGPVALTAVLARWPSVVPLALTAGAALVAAAPRGARAVGRLAALALAGLAAAAAIFHVLLVPWTTALPPLRAVNGLLLASGSRPPSALLASYWTTSVDLVRAAVVEHAPLLLAAAAAVVARGRLARATAWALGGAALSLSVWRAVEAGGLAGGPASRSRYAVTLLAALLVVLLVSVLVAGGRALGRVRSARAGDEHPAAPAVRARAEHPAGPAERAADQRQVGPLGPVGPGGAAQGRARLAAAGGPVVVAVLAVLPLAQVIGTNNAPVPVAFNGLGIWMALVIAVLTGLGGAPAPARALTAAVTAAALLVVVCVATGGLWRHPYRTVGRAQTTAPVAGVPALDSIRLDPTTAASYGELRRLLRPYTEPEGRAMVALDKMPGLVLALGGRPVGEAWTSSADRPRTAAGIRAECADGPPWWGDRAPIVLADRPIGRLERRALARCGLDFAGGYRQLPLPDAGLGIQVYVPAAEAPAAVPR